MTTPTWESSCFQPGNPDMGPELTNQKPQGDRANVSCVLSITLKARTKQKSPSEDPEIRHLFDSCRLVFP